MTDPAKVRTCLWFEKNGEDAAAFYTGLLPNSFIESTFRPDASGPPLTIEFTLAGAPYMILNGGPHYKLNPAASIMVMTEDQNETDRLWNALIADGGEESMCGWLNDRWGVAWQIVPRVLLQLLQSENTNASMRARDAMLKMHKIDIAALEAAFNSN